MLPASPIVRTRVICKPRPRSPRPSGRRWLRSSRLRAAGSQTSPSWPGRQSLKLSQSCITVASFFVPNSSTAMVGQALARLSNLGSFARSLGLDSAALGSFARSLGLDATVLGSFARSCRHLAHAVTAIMTGPGWFVRSLPGRSAASTVILTGLGSFAPFLDRRSGWTVRDGSGLLA